MLPCSGPATAPTQPTPPPPNECPANARGTHQPIPVLWLAIDHPHVLNPGETQAATEAAPSLRPGHIHTTTTTTPKLDTGGASPEDLPQRRNSGTGLRQSENCPPLPLAPSHTHRGLLAGTTPLVLPGLGDVHGHGGGCRHQAADHAGTEVAQNVVPEITCRQQGGARGAVAESATDKLWQRATRWRGDPAVACGG